MKQIKRNMKQEQQEGNRISEDNTLSGGHLGLTL